MRVLDAAEPVDPDGDWVAFRWGRAVPPEGRLAEAARSAGDAVLVSLAPGHRAGRVVDLDREPQAPLFGGANLLFRAQTLREHGLRPDPDLAPDLSALLLAVRCLLTAPSPTVATARVRGRTGAGGFRAGQPDPGRYASAPMRFARLLEQVHAERGSVPRWLQHVWLSQLFAYLREDSRFAGATASLGAAEAEAFHRALTVSRRYLDDDAIAAHAGRDTTAESRATLLLGADRRTGHTRPTRRDDPGRGLSRVSYYFSGARPEETVAVDGAAVLPPHHKIRAVEVVGEQLLAERIVWVPIDAVVRVDPSAEVLVAGTVGAERRLERIRRILAENRHLTRSLARDMRIRWRSHRRGARHRYDSAWLLMDRDTAAQDNAEHLYRHLSTAEPDVNAWFVLARDSPDWDRLRREGFRLIDYGSDDHFVALLNCAHLISSQVDDYVVKPFRRHALGPQRWRFTFLQHGVLWHDVSRWLNPKQIDCFVTSAPAEQAAIVADHTPYVFTDLEARMVGLPRHDRLLSLGTQAEPHRLLVMPTWRPRLLGRQEGGNARALLAGFWDSGYARALRALMESEAMRALCVQHGWQLDFVPHPNMEGCLDDAPLPEHVRTYRFSDIDVQATIAEAAVLVTDYSSLASEAAYIGRPVVYYQFDREEFFGDFRRLGSWNYDRDGFGPVTETAAETVTALERIATAGGPLPEYAARIERAFPLRDGLCCQRTVAAIRAISGT